MTASQQANATTEGRWGIATEIRRGMHVSTITGPCSYCVIKGERFTRSEHVAIYRLGRQIDVGVLGR
jgi:hypothetical protein